MNGVAVLAFARCAGFVSRAPGFSHPSVPRTVRAGLALMLTIAVMPALQHASPPDGIALVVAFACECAVGAAIGFGASILYDGAYAGGRVLDDYVGIRVAVPNAQVYAPSAFGRIWSLVFTCGFFVLGAYRYAVIVFAQSFERIPPGAMLGNVDLLHYAIALPSGIVEAALLVAGPAIAVAALVQFTLGALTRVIPRFASFTLSFPLVFGTVLLVTIAAIPLLYVNAARPWFYLPFGSASP
ncbi:MAG: flagellar biosynthetic protein FliR [Candidatus Eremiobacteraeota bacterium]|nr:flagellar biosynthetic protein FliR [Candidatus Eremiobacteraeota bacterium]